MPRTTKVQPLELDVTETWFHVWKFPHPPIVALAYQLERIEAGVPTSLIFSKASNLPARFDPAQPPIGIRPNSHHAILVDRFYNVNKKRECSVNLIEAGTEMKKRCSGVPSGFRDILKHQFEEHRRICHYICLQADCLAPFDKINNAKRHQKDIHSEAAIRKRREFDERRKQEMQKSVACARRTALLRIVSNREKKRTGRSRSEYLFQKLVSSVRKDVNSKTVRIAVSPGGSSFDNIARFHQENFKNGKLVGECRTQQEREWVGAIGLMETAYNLEGFESFEYEFYPNTKDLVEQNFQLSRAAITLPFNCSQRDP